MSTSIFKDFAFRYVEHGLSVFPCKEMAKTPRTKNGCREATTSYDMVTEWEVKWPNANIGIATGEVSGIWVLDLDGEEAEAWLATHPALPATPEVATKKGRHIYFKMPEGVEINNSASQLAPHVDVRGNGGYVIAPPSAHPEGGVYMWHKELKPSTTPFAFAPDWLLELVVKKERKRAAPEAVKRPESASSSSYVKKVVDEEYRILATTTQGSRNHQLFKSTVAMANYIGQGGLTTQMVESLAVAGAKSNGLVADDGMDSCMATISSAVTTGLANAKTVPATSQPEVEYIIRPSLRLVGSEEAEDGTWMAGLLYGGKADDPRLIKKSFHNGLLVMQKHPLMRDVLIYDVFADEVILNKCPPWSNIEPWKPRAIRDDDSTAATAWFETPQGLGLSIRPNDAHDIMLSVAKMHEVDPPRTWLESLQWDGVERIGHWLSDYCNVDENAYTQTVGRKFLIGAVQRIMQPGCQMDSMLILEGDQGHRKSTALKLLAQFGQASYFTDQVDDIGNKDALIQIQGVSIIEFAEMDTLNKADTDHIKKFVTRREDRYRPPYGRTLVTRPRRCVFAGTVNPGGNGYLKDPTGARRFWPVLVNSMIDIEQLGKITPQLWAEAFLAWKSGEGNWIDDPEVLKLAVGEQALRFEEEPWAPLLDKKMRESDAITVDELMTTLDIPKDRWSRRESNRIGAYLRHRKWEVRKDYRPHPASHPQRRWYAPADHVPQPAEDSYNDTM